MIPSPILHLLITFLLLREQKKIERKIQFHSTIQDKIGRKKQNDSQNNSLNTSLKITEIFPIEQEDLKKKIKNDLYLRKSVKLFCRDDWLQKLLKI